jgi:hypothetical protein
VTIDILSIIHYSFILFIIIIIIYLFILFLEKEEEEVPIQKNHLNSYSHKNFVLFLRDCRVFVQEKEMANHALVYGKIQYNPSDSSVPEEKEETN